MDWKKFIIQWNNEHPLDKKFREKYNIPFNSPQHRQISQLDIYLEYLEDVAYAEYEQKIEQSIEDQKALEKGEWIQPMTQQEIDKEAEDLFDKINISSLNEESKIQFK